MQQDEILLPRKAHAKHCSPLAARRAGSASATGGRQALASDRHPPVNAARAQCFSCRQQSCRHGRAIRTRRRPAPHRGGKFSTCRMQQDEILLPRKADAEHCSPLAAWRAASAPATCGRQEKMAMRAMFFVKTEILLPRKTDCISVRPGGPGSSQRPAVAKRWLRTGIRLSMRHDGNVFRADGNLVATKGRPSHQDAAAPCSASRRAATIRSRSCPLMRKAALWGQA